MPHALIVKIAQTETGQLKKPIINAAHGSTLLQLAVIAMRPQTTPSHCHSGPQWFGEGGRL